MIYKSEEGKNIIFGSYREILAAWPVENKQYHVATDFGDTFVIESGDANSPALFLLHGSVSNSFVWFGDVAALSEKFHVYAIDIIGEAGFSAQDRPAYESGAYPKWLEQVRIGVGVDKLSLAGLSLGGWMALSYATDYPQNVDNLILLCPGGLADEREQFKLEANKNMSAGDEGKQKILETLLGGKTENAAINKGLMFTLLIGQNFNPRMEKLPVFSGEALSQLTMPILLVFGENDFLLDAQVSINNLTRHAPHARADLLPGVGHVVVGQAARMLEFLA